ncbi:MAG: hypothetical protein ABIQ02_10565, partial [Saprospiraceae bacterium]
NALPYTIPAFAFSGNIDYVTVCDNQHSGCCATTGFLALNCAGCIIYNLQANPLPCNQQGQFFISIDFDYQNVSSEGFSITGNGMQLGNFNYNQVPILLGPFNGDGAQYFEFVVTDLVNGDCFDATELGTLPCSAICELSNLQVTTGECTGNNAYILHVNFDHTGTVSTGFNLLANGQYFDTYSYSDLPLTILEFPSSANGSDMIQVCDLGNSNCCTSLTFVSPDCQCSIFEITTETLGCTSDTTFAISVEFFSEHLLDNTVDVSIDGIFLGNFSIASIPFTVDNVPEGNTTAILTICGHVENDCCADAVIQLVNCEGPQCSIYNLSTNVGTCTSDTTYILDILFNHANLPVDSVNISANSHFIGKFLAQADSIRIINFPEYEENMTTLTVCAVNKPDCCDQFTFNTPDCTPDDCEVSGLFAVPGLCTSDSTYELVIEYATENIPNDSIILFANGNSIDTLYDPAHHIYIQYFPVSSTDTTIITICAYSFPDCCDTYSFATPSCEGAGPCHLYDLTAEPGSCQPDSTYLLVLNFLFDHLSVDSVSIVANGNNLGNFQVQEGHIVFDHFPVYLTPATTIQVCGSGNPECCDEVTFDTPHCGGPGECSINNLLIHIGDCLTDSTYVLFIDFLYQGLAVDSVLITSDGGFSHLYAINGGHLVLNPFYSPASGATTTLHVCAVGAADCCDESEFETPDCIGGGTCHIYDVTALPGACTSELTYILDFHFWWNNLPTDSVLIYANGLFIGTYHTDPNFIHIDNFPLLGETTNLEICSLGAPDCCGNVTFTNPACGANQCSIFDISVQTFDCNSDSTFGAIINFQYQNVTSTGFDAYTGDQYLGFYTLGQVPIIANQFPANASGEYVITICEHDNFNCCSSFQFEGPVCAEGACDISDFGYTLTNCDSAGNFYFILNFQYHNVGASGFNVVGNGNIYGNFGYDQLPIRIGPFPSDQTAFEFLVLDAENAACFDFIQPGEVQCTVGTSYVSKDEIYSLLNNGTLPVIFAKKDITL